MNCFGGNNYFGLGGIYKQTTLNIHLLDLEFPSLDTNYVDNVKTLLRYCL